MPPADALTIPAADKLWIKRARVPSAFLPDRSPGAVSDREGSVLVDVRIEHNRIAGIIAAADAEVNTPAVDLNGRHLWPTLVDMHTHIDKSQVISRIGPLDASFANAREAINADRAKHWNRNDIRARMEFSIRCAHVHGVAAIRTHLDSYQGQARPSWSVFAELRKAWSGRVALQATGSVPIDVYASPYGQELADLVADTEGGLLGGVLRRSTDHDYTFIDNIDQLLDAQFTLAKDRRLAVDLHVDETTASGVFHLEHVAKAVIRHKMQGRVVCGHCCSLALQPEDKIEQALALCAEAGIGIVTLPNSNLYLQDRKLGRTPRLRGVAPIHEIRAQNIPVAIASDNVRDSLYPFGDHDMLENFRQSVGIYHLDQCLGQSLAMIGPLPAAMMGISPVGSLTAGGPANFIVLDARSLNEIVSRPQANRVVVVNGRQVCETLPNFPAAIGDAL
jgi:cytosine/creatinine deaminase